MNPRNPTQNVPPPGDELADRRDRQFDAAMRALHTRAVGCVSPTTRACLRDARHQATLRQPASRKVGWALASVCAAVGALAVGLQLQSDGPASAPTPRAVASTSLPALPERAYDYETAVASLDESPDLYLWLASNDDAVSTAVME